MLALYLLPQLDSDQCVIFRTTTSVLVPCRPELDESVIPMHGSRVQT